MGRNFGLSHDARQREVDEHYDAVQMGYESESDGYVAGVPWPAIAVAAGLIAGIIVCIVVLAWMASLAQAHDWYTGLHNEKNEWCCGGSDCGPLPEGAVREVTGGFQVDYEGALPVGSTRIVRLHQFVSNLRAKPSKEDDGRFHACAVGNLQSGFDARCLFYPNRGY